jgi:polysaccharide deacetylase family protein (PEP-CTERM system associated)
MTNAATVPAPGQITFTLDLEDHRPDERAELRYPEVTRQLVRRLGELGIRGTVFVVGEEAERHPDLVREVAAAGHEVGLHGWRHRPLTELTPAELRADIERGNALLEELSGAPVRGFRAPMFSLVPPSRWATDVLAESGVAYSSSVLPARSPLFGDPSVPTHPFRWPSGLLELPCPVARVGGTGLPFLGGVYLRVLPRPVVDVLCRMTRGHDARWVYCHPYDFDPDEPYWVVPEAGKLGSRLLWRNRRRALARVERVLRGRVGPPLAEVAASLASSAPALAVRT